MMSHETKPTMVAPTTSPGLNMDHGFLKKIERNQMSRQQMVKDDATKKQESAKLARKVGHSVKPVRPSQPIYRPPYKQFPPGLRTEQQQLQHQQYYMNHNNNNSNSSSSSSSSSSAATTSTSTGTSLSSSANNGKGVHFQLESGLFGGPTNNAMTLISPENELKSVLKRSKSFSGNESRSSSGASSAGGVSQGSQGSHGSSGRGTAGHQSHQHHRVDYHSHPSAVAASLQSNRDEAEERARQMEFEKNDLPSEYLGLVKKALEDPNSLSSRQLMEVVTVLCNKAVEGIKSAQPVAQMCFTIIENERGETFLESLLNCCREWYNERDKLLFLHRSSPPGGGGQQQPQQNNRRWTAYVTFLMEIYLRLKSFHLQKETKNSEGVGAAFNHNKRTTASTSSATSSGRGSAGSSPSPTSSGSSPSKGKEDNQRMTLAMLIFECCHIILKTNNPPLAGNSVEIECLRSLLTTSGAHLEQDSFDRMEKLMCSLRDAFLDESTVQPVRKTLLELIELRASGWRFDLSQTSYYFPYTASLSFLPTPSHPIYPSHHPLQSSRSLHFQVGLEA